MLKYRGESLYDAHWWWRSMDVNKACGSIMSYDTYTVLTFYDAGEIGNKISSCLEKELPANCKLYFGRSAQFPRSQIKNTNYKKVTSPEKADYIVIGQPKYQCGLNTSSVIKNPHGQYVFINHTYSYKYGDVEYDGKTLIEKILPKDKKFEILETGIPLYTTIVTLIDIERLFDGTYKKLVFDTQLNPGLEEAQQSFTEEELKNIVEMILSPDIDIISLGLKMLIAYNIAEVPQTMRLLLCLPHLAQTDAWTSTWLKFIKKKIGWQRLCYTPYDIETFVFTKNHEVSDKDKVLSKFLYPYIMEKIGDEFFLKTLNTENRTFSDIKFKCRAE